MLWVFLVVDGCWWFEVDLDGIDPNFVEVLLVYEDVCFY